MTSNLTPAIAEAASRVTELAAIAAYHQVGRGDEKAADQAAVDAMRTALNACDFDGRIVIGEGERDEAPMLYIGEAVGKGGLAVDIALDPLEGTTLTAKAMANALAVLAISPRGGMLYAPDVYMDKIAIGPGYPEGIVNLDDKPSKNVKALARAKGVSVSEICVCVLDRPRHQDIIADLRSAGAKIALITDGDVAGIINATKPETGVDIYIGQGGAPEGVLAAAALRCIGGQMQAKLHFRNDDERGRANRIGIKDHDRVYDLTDLVPGDAIFAATGVTAGGLLEGVRFANGRVLTETLLMTSMDGLVRTIRTSRPL